MQIQDDVHVFLGPSINRHARHDVLTEGDSAKTIDSDLLGVPELISSVDSLEKSPQNHHCINVSYVSPRRFLPAQVLYLTIVACFNRTSLRIVKKSGVKKKL